MLSLFPRDVLDEILDLTESVSEGYPTFSLIFIQLEAAMSKFYDTHNHLDIRDLFDVRNRERVCLLEVTMKADLLI